MDTSAWSLAVRRRPGAVLSSADQAVRAEVIALIPLRTAALIGPVRQELLSGISDTARFNRLRDVLAGVPDEPCSVEDFELAAEFANTCRRFGIQGSGVDFLTCAVAARRTLPILASDRDFAAYARHLPIRLHRLTPQA